MKKLLLPVAVSSVFVFMCMMLSAQSKAYVHIRKNQNGVKSEETREIPLEEGQNIQDILMEMGVLDELGQLKDGQELEIRIDKSNGPGDLENFELLMAPDNFDMLSLPEFAPAPPMESRPFLGVMLRENYEKMEKDNGKGKSHGVYVTEVIEGTAAEKAGMLTGDIILEINKNEMNTVAGVIDYVQSREPGDKIEISLLRDGKKKKVKAELGEKQMEMNWAYPEPMEPMEPLEPGAPRPPRAPRPPMQNYNFRFGPDSITIFCPPTPNCICPNDSMKICQPFSWNGDGMAIQETAFLGVTPIDQGVPAGVMIGVEVETAAEKMGLEQRDIILQFNGVKVDSFDMLADEIAKTTPGSIVNILVLREGREKEISGEIGKRSVSGFEDFRIFHDFKGMDEGGNYFYDYEFDMDADDVEQRMQELLQELDQQQRMLDDERNRIEGELDRLHDNKEVMIIKIQIADITKEEADQVNKKASTKLQTTNNLSIDEISFFPNPNDGILNLNFSTSTQKPVKILLYNMEGEVVYLEERSSFDGHYKNTIDISDEPNGTYFLQIMQDGKSYSKKIIKGM